MLTLGVKSSVDGIFKQKFIYTLIYSLIMDPPYFLEPLRELFEGFPWASSILSGVIAGVVAALILKKWRV